MAIKFPPISFSNPQTSTHRRTAPFMASITLSDTIGRFGEPLSKITTASQWFCQRFPRLAKQYGAPFLENHTLTVDGFSSTSPVAPNIDFFAGCLAGDEGREVVYWAAECQFYYLEPLEKIYHPTQESKLGDLMRGLFVRCALEMQKDVNVVPLFTTFRSDAVIKLIVDRAKSILRAAEDFFSATSPNERVSGIEIHERLARLFVEKMLVSKPGEMVLAASVFDQFARLLRERDLFPLKRSQFKDLVSPLIREKFGSGFRGDLVINGKYQQGWKNLALNTAVLVE